VKVSAASTLPSTSAAATSSTGCWCPCECVACYLDSRYTRRPGIELCSFHVALHQRSCYNVQPPLARMPVPLDSAARVHRTGGLAVRAKPARPKLRWTRRKSLKFPSQGSPPRPARPPERLPRPTPLRLACADPGGGSGGAGGPAGASSELLPVGVSLAGRRPRRHPVSRLGAHICTRRRAVRAQISWSERVRGTRRGGYRQYTL
jgi:hypothetical protein